MIATVAVIFNDVRSLLADDEVSGGQIFTDSYLQTSQHWAAAYSDLFAALDLYSVPRGTRHNYYNLPINTSYLAPITAGIYNLGEPAPVGGVSERAVNHTGTITGVTLGTGYVDLTVTGHPFVVGQQVVVFGVGGISDDVNDQWTISVPDATTVRLNGCVATGTFTSGGTVSDSTENFTDVTSQRSLEYPVGPGVALGQYLWEGDVFRFPPSSTVRQLRITYSESGNAPTALTATVGMDDARKFLAHRTAAFAALSHASAGTKAAALNMLAVGNAAGELGECNAGFLGLLIRNAVKAMQMNRYQPPRFRPKRNTGPAGVWSGYGTYPI